MWIDYGADLFNLDHVDRIYIEAKSVGGQSMFDVFARLVTQNEVICLGRFKNKGEADLLLRKFASLLKSLSYEEFGNEFKEQMTKIDD